MVLMDPKKVNIDKMPKGTAKEVFKDLNSFHLVEFLGDGSDAKCSCKDYFHELCCVHVLVMKVLSDRMFKIPKGIKEEDPELRRRRGRRKHYVAEADAELQLLKKSLGKEARWDPHMAETMENGMMPAPPSHLSARQFDEVVRREREDIALPGWRFGGRGDGARDDSDDIGMASSCSSAVQKTLAQRNADKKREICGLQ